MNDGEATDDELHRATVVVGVVVALVGVAIIGTLAYVDLTTTVTESEYEAVAGNCADLENETVLVDGGLGRQPAELNRSAVERCRNTSFAEYRSERRQSVRHTPIGQAQWAMYGGVAALFIGGGGALLRREFDRVR